MKTLKSILAGAASMFIILFGISFFLPSDLQTTQTIWVECNPEKAFEQVSTLRNWENWAFSDEEKALNPTFRGSESGVGALYTWEWEGQTGRVEILESKAQEKVVIKSSQNSDERVYHFEFSFTPKEKGTEISWQQSAELDSYTLRYMKLFGMLEKVIKEDMQERLERLRGNCQNKE